MTKVGMLDDVSLQGEHGALVPLAPAHRDALSEAAAEGDLWKLWYTSVPSPEHMEAEIAHRLGLLAAGKMRPFTILDRSGVPVGMTTFCNVEPEVPRLAIGHTW